MRVIAGKARSLRLKTIEGMDTRPTTDRIKETLFNMIQPSIADSRFLDLFAGSGGIGIEALSRGASWCVFVEQQRKAAECIRENLAFTRLKEDATLLVTDAVSAVNKLDGEDAFSWIFMDPPYNHEFENRVLEYDLNFRFWKRYRELLWLMKIHRSSSRSHWMLPGSGRKNLVMKS